MDLLWTNGNARAAAHACRRFKHDLIFPFQSLRIRTPLTAKRTSLKENQSSYARSIIHIVFLLIEYKRFSFDYVIIAHFILPSVDKILI